MEELLATSARYIGFAVEAMAMAIIAVGSVKAFFAGLGAMVLRPSQHQAIREVWLDYARYLIAGPDVPTRGGHREDNGRANLGRRRQTCRDCGHPDVPELFP